MYLCMYVCIHTHTHTQHTYPMAVDYDVAAEVYMRVLKMHTTCVKSCTHTCIHTYMHTYTCADPVRIQRLAVQSNRFGVHTHSDD